MNDRLIKARHPINICFIEPWIKEAKIIILCTIKIQNEEFFTGN